MQCKVNRAAWLLAAGLPWAVAWAQDKPTVITNARIETQVGRVIENGYIAFEKGKIVYVGEAMPNGTYTQIDGKGLWVFPGFVDAFVTRGTKQVDPKASERRDDTTTAPATMQAINRQNVRAELKAADLLAQDPMVGSYRELGFTALNCVPNNGVLRGTSAVIFAMEGKKEEVVINPSTAMGASFGRGGFGPGGGGQQGYPGALFGFIAVYRQTMLDAQRYEEQIKAGGPVVDVFEALTPVLDRKLPILFQADTGEEIYRALRLKNEFNSEMIMAPARGAGTMIDALKQNRVDVIVSPAIGTQPAQSENPDTLVPAAILAEQQEAWRDNAKSIFKLQEQAVPFALTAYLGTSSFVDELNAQIGQGVTRDTLLKSLTVNPARILGLVDKIGTLEVGKFANITILTGDLGNSKSKVAMVVTNGQVFNLKKESK